MFNIREFIIKNLIDGVKNKSFTKEYASILAVNYLVKGILTQDDLIKFNEEITILENTAGEEIPEDTEENVEEKVEVAENEQSETTEEVQKEVTEAQQDIAETTEKPTEETEVE